MKTVIFFREGMFYPIELLPGKDTISDIAEHVALNPGTLRVEDTQGNVLWAPANN